MIRKKERVHASGISNIDYRSLGSRHLLSQFQPWKENIDYGTMGHSKVGLSVDKLKNFMNSYKNILTTKEINFQSPNPKLYSSAIFYLNNNIALKKRNLNQSDKIAELDESMKGKNKFTGDTLMISHNTKIKKSKISLPCKIIDETIRFRRNDKSEKNKEAEQESQLVTIKTSITNDNNINIDKIREVILAIRRRYTNRNNFAKIFKEWDISNNGVISINDAHNMINQLGIPINYNETKILISTNNKENIESLDLAAFMNLIFSNNQKLGLDNFEIKDKILLKEGEKIDIYTKEHLQNIRKSEKIEDNVSLKNFLRTRIPILINKFNSLVEVKENLCNFQTFSKLINSITSNKISNTDILNGIFEEFKNKDGLMNFKMFITDISKLKEMNDFFGFQEKYVDLLNEKLVNSENDLSKLKLDNDNLIRAENKINNENKQLNYDQTNKGIKKYCLNDNNVSNSQPNKEFMIHLFEKRDEYSKKNSKLIQNLEQGDKSLAKRFSSMPIINKENSVNIGALEGSGQYLCEKDRFNVRNKREIEIVENEKKLKMQINKSREQSIQKVNQFIKERNDIKNFISEQKIKYSMIEKIKKLKLYEMVYFDLLKKHKIRNDLIE